MNPFKKTLIVLGCIGALEFASGNMLAQDFAATGPQSPVAAARHARPENTMAMLREQLDIRDNAKWTVVSEKIRAVLDAREKLALEFGGRPPRLPGVPLRL